MARHNTKKILELAVAIARKAGLFLLDHVQSGRTVKEDFSRDVKVEADKKLEEFIVKELLQHTDYPILSEESGLFGPSHPETLYRWIVDPLDGSLNFSREIPLCAISIGLWREREPVLGVVFDFNRDEMFSGLVDVGAWLNGESIHPGYADKISDAILATGFPVSTDFSHHGLHRFAEKIKQYKKIRLFGTAALSVAYAACGRVDVYMENNIKIWDVAAGLAIAKAAGAVNDVTVSPGDNTLNVKVTNPYLFSPGD